MRFNRPCKMPIKETKIIRTEWLNCSNQRLVLGSLSVRVIKQLTIDKDKRSDRLCDQSGSSVSSVYKSKEIPDI